MKTTLLPLAFCAAALAAPADAQFAFVPYGGYNTEIGGFMVGAGFEYALPVGESLSLGVRPTAEFHAIDIDESLLDNFDYYQLNADLVGRFTGSEAIAPYVGLGLALGLVSYDIGEDNSGDSDSSTEVGLNLLGGVEFPGVFSFGAPFAQARYTTVAPEAGDLVTYGSQLSVFGGFRIVF